MPDHLALCCVPVGERLLPYSQCINYRIKLYGPRTTLNVQSIMEGYMARVNPLGHSISPEMAADEKPWPVIDSAQSDSGIEAGRIASPSFRDKCSAISFGEYLAGPSRSIIRTPSQFSQRASAARQPISAVAITGNF